MPRLGLFGGAAPRIKRTLAPEPQITERELPPTWMMERARARGQDPMLEWEAMQQGAGAADAAVPVTPSPAGLNGGSAGSGIGGAARGLGMMMRGPTPPSQPSPMSPDFFDLGTGSMGAGSNGSLLDLRNAAAAIPGSGITMPKPQPAGVKDGMQIAAQGQGAFFNGPRPPVEPAKSEDDGGFWRMFGYRPDETGQEFGEWLFSDRKGVERATTAARSSGILDALAPDDQYRPLVEALLREGNYEGALKVMDGLKPVPKEYSSVSFGDGGLGAFDPITGTMNPLVQSTPKPPPESDYVETTLSDGVYFVNKNDPNDKFRIGAAPPKAGGEGSQPAYEYKEVNGKLVAINKANPRDIIEIGPAGSGVPKTTPMQQAVDKNWADDLVEWASVGSSDFVKQMEQLDYAIGELQSGAELSGPGNNMFPGGIGRNLFGQHGMKVQESVEEVVQRNLRAVLGAAFTQAEGDRLISRAYNPSLEEDENLRRLQLLRTQMQIAADQKTDAMNYYNENGTMVGFAGHIPTKEDFEAVLDSADNAADKAPAARTSWTQPTGAQPQNSFQWGRPSASNPNAQPQTAQVDTPPPGIDPDDWKYMSPEDKAKFR